LDEGGTVRKAIACSIVLVLLSGACGGGDDGTRETTGTSAEGGKSTEDNKATGTLTFPRSLRYAGTTWTVRSLERASAASTASAPAPQLRLDVEILNTNTDVSLTFPTDLVALVAPDGTATRAQEFVTAGKSATSLQVPLEAKVQTVVVVNDPAVDPASLSFRIAESDKEPAVVALGGPEPKAEYPHDLVVSGGEQEAKIDYGLVKATVLGAHLDVDQGSKRATKGTVFVTVKLRITGISDVHPRPRIGEQLKLAVDGVVRGGRYQVANAAPGQSTDVTDLFEVPAATRSLQLVLGYAGEKQATFDLAKAS
jgi:hypothetical protein